MKPVKQKYRHDPGNGIYGDCDRACIASMLELTCDDVPHFFDGPEREDPEKAFKARREWLEERGVEFFVLNLLPGDMTPEGMINYLSIRNPGKYFLLTGESRNGTGHVVICRDGEIVHDPSLDGSGIVGPEPVSGCYWVEFWGSPLCAGGRVL